MAAQDEGIAQPFLYASGFAVEPRRARTAPAVGPDTKDFVVRGLGFLELDGADARSPWRSRWASISVAMRVFMSVSLGFLTMFLSTADVDDPVQMVSWLLILLPLMVAGVIASLKVGELAGMLVSGGGGAGMTGALMTAATGGKAMLAGKAARAAGVK